MQLMKRVGGRRRGEPGGGGGAVTQVWSFLRSWVEEDLEAKIVPSPKLQDPAGHQRQRLYGRPDPNEGGQLGS